jgi:hypothetical protein
MAISFLNGRFDTGGEIWTGSHVYPNRLVRLVNEIAASDESKNSFSLHLAACGGEAEEVGRAPTH